MITLPKQHPIIVDFVFPNLSKFQALSFKVERKECSTTIKQIADDLKSVVVQLNEETKEEKHSSLPLTVLKYETCSQNKTQCFNNIHALLFTHPGCEYEVRTKLEKNITWPFELISLFVQTDRSQSQHLRVVGPSLPWIFNARHCLLFCRDIFHHVPTVQEISQDR